jgi:hypothetical protein
MKQKKFKNPKWPTQKKLSFSKSPILKNFLLKFYALVLGSVGLIDVKGIDVAQPIWLRDCSKTGKNALFVFFPCF